MFGLDTKSVIIGLIIGYFVLGRIMGSLSGILHAGGAE